MFQNRIENVSRRGVLRGLGVTAGLVLAVPVGTRRSMAAYSTGADKMPHGTVNDPKVFVSIAPDGIVTIIAARSEMGTGVRTSLPMVVADEMEADWNKVRVQQAPGDEAKYGNQDTDGSRSTRHFLIPMRQVGASARMMLEAAAAKRWNVPVTQVKAVNHEVIHVGTNQKLGYGELATMPRINRLRTPFDTETEGPEGLPLYRQRPYRHRRSARHHHRQGDVWHRHPVAGLKYAVIARPPVTGGKLVSFDASDALKVSGVEQVIEVQGWPWPSKFQPLGGVAVIARNTGAAIKGRDALKVVWDDGANASYDSVAYRKELEDASRSPVRWSGTTATWTRR